MGDGIADLRTLPGFDFAADRRRAILSIYIVQVLDQTWCDVIIH